MQQVNGTAELELPAPSSVLLKLDDPLTMIARKTLTTVQCMPGFSTFQKLSFKMYHLQGSQMMPIIKSSGTSEVN